MSTSQSLPADPPGSAEFGRLPESLRELIERPKRLSALRLWKTLEDWEKKAALKACHKDRHARELLVGHVAEVRHLRKKTVQGWDEEKLVGFSLRVTPNRALAYELLLALHKGGRGEMLGAFFDAIGLPHRDGDPEPGYADLHYEESQVQAAADQLAHDHGLRRAVVFFLFAAILEEVYAEHLIAWLARRSSDTAAADTPPGADESVQTGTLPDSVGAAEAVHAPEVPRVAEPSEAGVAGAEGDRDEVAPPEAPPRTRAAEPDEVEVAGEEAHEGAREDESDPVRQRSLTTLDYLLEEAMVAAKQGIEGCLDEDQIDDAVDEFVSLNGKRPHSCFHLGFRDVLFKGRASPDLPVPGSEQSRWYWAGAIAAWEKSESWDEIARAHDQHAHVRALGDGGDFAAERAAPLVVGALRHEGREAEVPNFVQVAALERSRTLFDETLEVGTKLLHDGEDGPARAVFRRLMRAVRRLEKEGEAPATPRFLDVRRRFAHALQRANEHDRARRNLEHLLEFDPDPDHQAMVHADLGLLASGFNRLADILLPRDADALPDMEDRLNEGRDHYVNSAAQDVPYAAHGHYCLGVTALARAAGAKTHDEAESRYATAESHLRRARNRFGSRRGSYGEELVERTNLYFGIAAAAQIKSAADGARAARVIVGALRAGAALPSYLIRPVVAALDVTAAAEDLSSLAEVLLDAQGSEALDALSRSESIVRECAPVLEALSARAERRGGSRAAAADYRLCLPGYLRASRREAAEGVLDRLETLAVSGFGRAEFEELLSREPDGAGLPWTSDEAVVARARCLEAANKLDDAMSLLQPLFHEYATLERLDEAAGVLERMKGYGLPSEYLKIETDRMTALRRQERTRPDRGQTSTERPSSRVRILVVGGDERQAKGERVLHDMLRRRDPTVVATLIHPGWDSNWSVAWRDVRGKLPGHDAVVLMRFMRTQLGRQIRKHCSVPWRFCWSGGRTAMVNAIMEAAEAARGSG